MNVGNPYGDVFVIVETKPSLFGQILIVGIQGVVVVLKNKIGILGQI